MKSHHTGHKFWQLTFISKIFTSILIQNLETMWSFSLPQEIFSPKRDFETRKKIKKAVKSWRNDGALKDVSITDSEGWLCCETPRDWHFLCFFHPPSHLTIFCCLYFVLSVYDIYILSYYHNSPSCFTLILYLHESSTYRSTPVLPLLIPFRVLYFDIFLGWLDFIVK